MWWGVQDKCGRSDRPEHNNTDRILMRKYLYFPQAEAQMKRMSDLMIMTLQMNHCLHAVLLTQKMKDP
jgi:hypothetical protein